MSEKIYICNFCDKEYKSRNGLWSHKKECKNKLEAEEEDKKKEATLKLMEASLKLKEHSDILTQHNIFLNGRIEEQKEQINQLLEQNRLLLAQLQIKNASENNNNTN